MRSRGGENRENVEFWWKGRAIAGAISANNYTSSGKVSVYEHTSLSLYIYICVCTRAGEERRKWRDLKAEAEANQKHRANFQRAGMVECPIRASLSFFGVFAP